MLLSIIIFGTWFWFIIGTGKEDYKLELITNIIGIIIGAGAEDLTCGILEIITVLIELIEIYFTIGR